MLVYNDVFFGLRKILKISLIAFVRLSVGACRSEYAVIDRLNIGFQVSTGEKVSCMQN